MIHSRRQFLRSASLLGTAAASGALSPLLWPAKSFAAVSDYKALVCLFLYGGNDNANTLVPVADPEYQAYLAQRGGAAGSGGVGVPLSRLQDTKLAGSSLALNPGFKRVASLYNASTNNVAVLQNVGTLIEPTVKGAKDALLSAATGGPALLPPKLRSHNDQQAFWQSFGAEGTSIGWGGLFGDAFLTDGSNTTNVIFSNVSAAGSALFINGARTFGYQVSTQGAVAFNALKTTGSVFGLNNTDARSTLARLLEDSGSPRIFERDLNALRKRSVDADSSLTAALTTVGDTAAASSFTTPLGAQLRMILRMVRAGKVLGLKRQVFFVSLGGFDMHDGLITYNAEGVPGASTQEALLGVVDGALADFYSECKNAGVGDQVTAFTASDFGRTYNPNNDGSDHGWGSHHLVLGGAVKGGLYGTLPKPDPLDPAWMSRGVFIPSTSTQQLAWTLGEWFNVDATSLGKALPGIENFTNRSLGFMRS
jgi:uncharacterized protein (DUF1501 family)